jgi:hypothetical protein
MSLYTIHAPKKPDGVAADPADFVFIKDGFCWPALFIPIIWIIYRRLWLVLLIYIVAVFVLSTLAGLAGGAASFGVLVLFALYFALEANGLRRWTYERRRHALIGVVEGRNRDEAELRFYVAAAQAGPAEDATPAAPASPAPPPPAPPTPWKAASGEPEVVGLFPAPGTSR